MRSSWIAMTAVALLAAPAYAKLEIKNVEAVYGPLGPVRTSTAYFPSDEVVYRYLVTGAKVDAEGKVDCEVAVNLIGPDGKVVQNETYTAQGILNFGGDSFSAASQVALPGKLKPGLYTLTVVIKDGKAKEEASFRRGVDVKQPEFAIVAPRFSYDLQGQVDAPVSGVLGQTLYIQLKVIGFDLSRNRIDTEMNVRVLDEHGKELTPNPIRIKGNIDDPELVKQADHLNYKSELFLNQPGKFTLSIAVVDWISKKTVRFETPLHIAAL